MTIEQAANPAPASTETPASTTTTPAPASSPPASTPSESRSSAKALTDPVDILKFDPFAKKEDTASSGGGKPPAPVQAEGPVPAPGESAPAQPNAPSQLEAIQRLLASQGETTVETPAQPQADPFDPAARYEWPIPEPLVQGLMAEDPAVVRHAVATLTNGIANAIRKDMLELMGLIRAEVPQVIQARHQAQELHSKFYGKYKEFNNPALYPVVARVAKAVYTQKAAMGLAPDPLSDAYHDEVAANVRMVLGQAAPKAPPAPPLHASNGSVRSDTVAQPGEGFMDVLGLR